MIYKTLKKVSNVCQLLDKSKYSATQTNNGITFTNNGDGTITVNGTSTNEIYYVINLFGSSLYSSHKYLLTGENSGLYLFVENRAENNAILSKLEYNKIASLPSNTKKSNCLCYIKKETICDNLILKPQLFDLTEMYGAGNEPTTVEQFRQDFPDEMYDYKPYCFVKSYKTLLKASDYCQLLDKSTYPTTKTVNGVTFTNNGDGTITVNSLNITANAFFELVPHNIATKNGHKYCVLSGANNEGGYFYVDILNENGAWIAEIVNNVYTVSNDNWSLRPKIFADSSKPFGDKTYKPQLFDLTEMFGAGNEPTTVEEFREKFPNELYDYKPYSIITSYKKSLVCTTKNLFDKTAVYTQTLDYDFPNCELIETTDNGWVVKGNTGSVPGSANHSSGWFSPLSYAEAHTPEKCISLKQGDIVTISAYYTVLENNATSKSGIYIGGTKMEAAASITLPEVGIKTRFSQKYTISEDGIYRPVFTLNSSKILIEDIQVEYGTTPTEYHPYGYL